MPQDEYFQLLSKVSESDWNWIHAELERIKSETLDADQMEYVNAGLKRVEGFTTIVTDHAKKAARQTHQFGPELKALLVPLAEIGLRIGAFLHQVKNQIFDPRDLRFFKWLCDALSLSRQSGYKYLTLYQALRSLSPLGFPDSSAPSFAGKKLASTNTSSQSKMPWWSNSERKARHMSLRTSDSYHSFRRRQQVEGFGYRSGRSFHLAPVLKIHSIPSNTSRSSALGRPPFQPTGFLDVRSSIFFHCSSVKYATRLLTGLTSGEMRIPKTERVQGLYVMRDITRLHHIRGFATVSRLNFPIVQFFGTKIHFLGAFFVFK